jgi:DNA-binding response OmpR family regulator
MQMLNVDLLEPKVANVLIIDDDIDSAILMDSMFRQFGCATTCTLEFQDAPKRICAGKADIIILDWMLGERVMADRVLLESIHLIDKFKSLRSQFCQHKTKIISYSSLSEDQLKIPSNRYFEHFDHWRKPMGRHELVHRANALLQSVSF